MTTSKTSGISSSDEVKLWKLPEVMDEDETRKRELTTTAQLENIQKQAYAEAHEKGYKDGLKRSEEELSAIQKNFNNLMVSLTEPFADMDDMVVEQMAELSIAIARQLIRRELHTDPGQVIGVVREAMTELPIGSRNIEIYLHPEDASMVRDAFAISEGEQQTVERLWRIIEDPAQTRGGCRITSENSLIDATIEARINRVIAQLLGGEREHDDQPNS